MGNKPSSYQTQPSMEQPQSLQIDAPDRDKTRIRLDPVNITSEENVESTVRSTKQDNELAYYLKTVYTTADLPNDSEKPPDQKQIQHKDSENEQPIRNPKRKPIAAPTESSSKKQKNSARRSTKRAGQNKSNYSTAKLKYTPNNDSNDVINLSSDDEEEVIKKVPDQNPLLFQHERIAIYKNDLDCLAPKDWLNDNVVDLYLSLLKQKYANNQNVRVFNSQFFAKLRGIRDSKDKTKNYFEATAGWFKDEEISRSRFWLIPVCDKEHWYLITIARAGSNKPVILVLDSLRKKTYDSVDLIKTFLKQKYKAEHKGKFKKFTLKIIDIPKQRNHYDCGLHLLRSVELFIKDDANTFVQALMDPNKSIKSSDLIFLNTKVPSRKKLLKSILLLAKKD